MHVAQWMLSVAMLCKNTPVHETLTQHLFYISLVSGSSSRTSDHKAKHTLHSGGHHHPGPVYTYVRTKEQGGYILYSSYCVDLMPSHYLLLANVTTFHITLRNVHTNKLVFCNSLRHFTFFMHFPAEQQNFIYRTLELCMYVSSGIRIYSFCRAPTQTCWHLSSLAAGTTGLLNT